MADPSDKFKINLNQNLWGAVVAYSALGASEHWGLPWLRCVSVVAAWIVTISLLITTVAYTINYWKKTRVAR